MKIKVKDIIDIYADSIFSIYLKNGLDTFIYSGYKKYDNLGVKISLIDKNNINHEIDYDEVNALSEAYVDSISCWDTNEELEIYCHF